MKPKPVHMVINIEFLITKGHKFFSSQLKRIKINMNLANILASWTIPGTLKRDMGIPTYPFF